ncbi:MAG: type II toxin-antitoxin system RelE/ParE family toxin [Asticcacaulis sp.]|nr:type II toxin-antitoxin system RelE/ParE family toxin [Asticcacaulis sp.]
MADYKLSRKAEADLRAIAAFTVDTFGIAQARTYRDGLLDAFIRISAHPEIGASLTHIFPDTRRLVHGSHIIYYRVTLSQIFVRRILHQSQDPLRHL